MKAVLPWSTVTPNQMCAQNIPSLNIPLPESTAEVSTRSLTTMESSIPPTCSTPLDKRLFPRAQMTWSVKTQSTLVLVHRPSKRKGRSGEYSTAFLYVCGISVAQSDWRMWQNPWCEAVLYLPDPPSLIGGGSGY